MIRRLVLILTLCLSALGSPVRADIVSVSSPTQPSADGKSVVVVFNDDVDNYSRDQLFNRFKEARALGARNIILQITTPGGLVTSALDISHFLKTQKDLHIVAMVKARALSAGAMIAMACDEIVMEPASQVGDCAPISINSQGELQSLGETERAKFQGPILTDFEDSARRNGYSVLLAQSMVAMPLVVHYIEDNSGQKRFVNENEYKELTRDGAWKNVADVPSPVDSGNTLLTVSTDMATKLGISKGTYGSPEEFATARGWTIVQTLAPSGGETFIKWMNNPAIRGLLMFIFMQSVWIALSHPGHGAPEAIAVTSLGLLLGVPLLTGYAQWWEVLMIFTGIALLALEIFVIPGFGIPGITGIILLLAGLLMTFVGTDPMPGLLPQLNGTWSSLRKGLYYVTGSLVAAMFLSYWLRSFLPSMPYFNRLILSGVSGETIPLNVESKEGRWPGIGVEGLAVTDLKPSGSAQFLDLGTNDQRVISVVSESGFVSRGTTVRVSEVSGNRVVVRT